MSKSADLSIQLGELPLVHMYDPADYNPQAAHDYYERTKHLKGRHGSTKLTKIKPTAGSRNYSKAHHVIKKHAGSKVPAESAKTHALRTEAKVKSLSAKLARLSQILSKLVADAKKRSGIDPTTAASKAATAAAASGKSKPLSKLSPAEKAKAAAAAKAYRLAHKPTPDQQVQQLEDKITKITQKIHDLRAAAAAAKPADTKRPSSSVGARAKPTK